MQVLCEFTGVTMRQARIADELASQTMNPRINRSIGFICTLFAGLSVGYSAAHDGNPRIHRSGTIIRLRQDATNEDLKSVRGEKGISALYMYGVVPGGEGPFITDPTASST